MLRKPTETGPVVSASLIWHSFSWQLISEVGALTKTDQGHFYLFLNVYF